MQTVPNTDGWLLSGASGWVGSALGTELAAAGISTLRLVRGVPAAPGNLCWNPAAERPVVELEKLEGLRVAVHLSGSNVAAHRWSPACKRQIASSRVESTRALARMLAELRQPPEVLVVASAVGIYGNRGNEILNDDAEPGSGFLAKVCTAWEQAAESALAAGIRVVHARLGVVLGPGGGALAKMLPAFRLGLGGSLGTGRQWMSWISLQDAVRAFRFAADTPSVAGSVNLVAPEPVTNADFTRALARQLCRPAILPAPAFALRLAFGQMAEETLLASQRAIPARLEAEGFHFSEKSVDQALAIALGSVTAR